MLADSNAIATVAVRDLKAAEQFYGGRLGLAPEHREGEEVITYRVERGDRHNLLRVEVTGNRYFDTELLRSRMSA